jgi:hypothetical protein
LLAPDDPTTDVPTSDDSRPGLHDTLTGVRPEAEAGETPAPEQESGAPEPGEAERSEPPAGPESGSGDSTGGGT